MLCCTWGNEEIHGMRHEEICGMATELQSNEITALYQVSTLLSYTEQL